MRCPALALSLWMPIRRTCGLDADACPSLPVCAAGPVGIAETTGLPATEWRYASDVSRLEHSMDDREQELKDVPHRPADKSRWPKGIRSISYDEADALGVDAKGELFWHGKPVEIRRTGGPALVDDIAARRIGRRRLRIDRSRGLRIALRQGKRGSRCACRQGSTNRQNAFDHHRSCIVPKPTPDR